MDCVIVFTSIVGQILSLGFLLNGRDVHYVDLRDDVATERSGDDGVDSDRCEKEGAGNAGHQLFSLNEPQGLRWRIWRSTSKIWSISTCHFLNVGVSLLCM